MKLRSLLVLAAGVGIGWALAKKATEDDPNVVAGPRESTRGPALRLIQGRAQRLADQATGKGLDAIRSARHAIRGRLPDDDAAWN